MQGLVYLTSAALLLGWNPIAPPPAAAAPKPAATKIEAPVKIVHGAAQNKITIPRKFLPEGAVVVAPAPAPNARGEAGPPMGTIIAGIALSLAAVSLVFVVRGSRGTKLAAAAVLVGAATLGAWSAAQADLIPGRPNGPAAARGAKIVIEVVDDGELVTLQLQAVR